jgi:hypothetical protein
MCLCLQPYRHNTLRCLDDQVPPEETGQTEPKRLLKGSDMMTDNRGLTYMAVRNCDLDRFSVK